MALTRTCQRMGSRQSVDFLGARRALSGQALRLPLTPVQGVAEAPGRGGISHRPTVTEFAGQAGKFVLGLEGRRRYNAARAQGIPRRTTHSGPPTGLPNATTCTGHSHIRATHDTGRHHRASVPNATTQSTATYAPIVTRRNHAPNSNAYYPTQPTYLLLTHSSSLTFLLTPRPAPSLSTSLRDHQIHTDGGIW